jgi:nitroimidazol reductase NimA-like FMN-containing flavoprotein (pyridoxamine 5'-phosphate oxidase superfamily)
VRRKDREVRDQAEILSILQKADVCRLAMSDDDVPYMVTMNFGLKNGGESLYFHCAGTGKKIDILKKNNLVCFQADIEHEFFLHDISCGCSMKYKSVIGMGRVHFVTEWAEKIQGLKTIMEHYTRESSFPFKEELVEKTTVLRLDIEEISGKALAIPGHLNRSTEKDDAQYLQDPRKNRLTAFQHKVTLNYYPFSVRLLYPTAVLPPRVPVGFTQTGGRKGVEGNPFGWFFPPFKGEVLRNSRLGNGSLILSLILEGRVEK